MTDRELKKYLKRLGIILGLVVLTIVILSVYILGITKTELSICNSQEYNHFQMLGIEEEEFKQYLSIFGNLVDEELNENQRIFHTSISFMDHMGSEYEAKTSENGLKTYDAEVIKKIAKEICGTYEKQNMEPTKDYAYEEETKSYRQNQMLDKFPYCIEITELSKNGENIEVTYEIAFMTSQEIAQYELEPKSNFETKTVKASMMKNIDYEYAKYFVSKIEII